MEEQPNLQTLLSEDQIMSVLVSGMIVLAAICIFSCLVAMWTAWKRKEYRR